jgi:hypothetical protein
MVRAAALKGLERHASHDDMPRLLTALARVEDPTARSEVAILIGSLGAAADLRPLTQACAAYADAMTVHGCVTARAWIGDPTARAEFTRQMGAARERELARYLEHAGRIRAPWLVPALVPLLADTTPVKWIGADGLPGPETLRAADVAVNLLAAITGRRFGFPISDRVNYTEAQRAEVRAALSR